MSTQTLTAASARPVAARRRGARPARSAVATVLKYLSLVAVGLAVVVPMSVVLFTSLKTATEATTIGALDPPSNWFNFDNYVKSFNDGRIGR